AGRAARKEAARSAEKSAARSHCHIPSGQAMPRAGRAARAANAPWCRAQDGTARSTWWKTIGSSCLSLDDRVAGIAPCFRHPSQQTRASPCPLFEIQEAARVGAMGTRLETAGSETHEKGPKCPKPRVQFVQRIRAGQVLDESHSGRVRP